MTTIESKIGTVKADADRLFNIVSDMSKLESLKDHLPSDKISNWAVTPDTLSFNVGGMADINFRVIDREPYKTIKYEGDGAGLNFNFWIQLKQVAQNDTRIKLTFKSEMNFMMRTLLEGKIKSGMDKMIDGFENIAK